MTSYLDPTIQASMEMMTIVKQLKDLTVQEKPQVPKPILSFLAALSIDLLPQLLRHVFYHSHLNNEAQAAELLYLIMQYAKKPELEPRTGRYEIDIAKATENGKCAQVTFELPGRKICLVRVAKVYTIGSGFAQIQYRVISSTETGIVGDIEGLAPSMIEENGEEDDACDHLSSAHPSTRPAIEPVKEPIAQAEDPQWLYTWSKPSTQSSYDPARAAEKGHEENLKICDALIDGSGEKILQANYGSNIETQPIWEDLKVVPNPVLATDVSDNA